MFNAHVSTIVSQNSASEPPKIRLSYLDGLRGLAAIYVFLNHLCQEVNWRMGESLPPLLESAMHGLIHGRFAVGIFIVLSGYCLTIPVAKSARPQLSGSFWRYIQRRSRRILPPYYAALLLCLLLFILVPQQLYSTLGYHWNNVQPAFVPGALLSHFLLVHNFRLDWVYKINGPFWSVATEWQIYFLFPLILLPAWRRWGLFAAIAIAFAIGLAPHYLVPDPIHDDYNFLDWAVPWYLGLFALGMAGAAINFSSQASLKWWQNKLPWQWICLGLLAILISQRSHWSDDRVWSIDALLGAATVSLLIYCSRCLTATNYKQHPFVLKLLASQWTVTLGSFSYSLYLIHAPLLGIVHLLVNHLPVSPLVQIFIFPALAIPLVLILSYCFHLVFERRFISS